MNLSSLQTLTWATVAGAIVSALSLAAVESRLPTGSSASTTGPKGALALPTEPTAAGPIPQAAASAARMLRLPANR